MYRMFTSNKDASPLCRAERRGRAVGTLVRCPWGSRGSRALEPDGDAGCSFSTLLTWRRLDGAPLMFGGGFHSKSREGSAPAWRLLPTHLQRSK